MTTLEAAGELGVSLRRVQAMVSAYQKDGPGRGRLKATKIGRDFLIEPKDLEAVRVRKTGRPLGYRPPPKKRKSDETPEK